MADSLQTLPNVFSYDVYRYIRYHKHVTCTAVITGSTFFKILTKDTPLLACERSKACLVWVHTVIYFLLQSQQCCVHNHVILGRFITTPAVITSCYVVSSPLGRLSEHMVHYSSNNDFVIMWRDYISDFFYIKVYISKLFQYFESYSNRLFVIHHAPEGKSRLHQYAIWSYTHSSPLVTELS